MFACLSTPNKALLRVREVVMYLALVEGQAGVDVLTVNSLQKAAASVERRLLLPCLELAEQLTVHLQVRNYMQSHHRLLKEKALGAWALLLLLHLLPPDTRVQWAAWPTGRAESPAWRRRCSCSCCGPSWRESSRLLLFPQREAHPPGRSGRRARESSEPEPPPGGRRSEERNRNPQSKQVNSLVWCGVVRSHLAQSFFQLFFSICLFDVCFSHHFVSLLENTQTVNQQLNELSATEIS